MMVMHIMSNIIPHCSNYCCQAKFSTLVRVKPGGTGIKFSENFGKFEKPLRKAKCAVALRFVLHCASAD